MPGIKELEVIASYGLAVSRDGRCLVAGSLLGPPRGAPPLKPNDMSERVLASHHGSAKTTPQASRAVVGRALPLLGERAASAAVFRPVSRTLELFWVLPWAAPRPARSRDARRTQSRALG
jgi:hypothetical protein